VNVVLKKYETLLQITRLKAFFDVYLSNYCNFITNRRVYMAFKKQYLKSKAVCKVTFKISKDEAHEAESVRLVGDFNNWDKTSAPMKKLKDGSFTATLELEKDAKYQFRYLLNDLQWENDAAADEYLPSPISYDENSVVTV
jgi:1,4-alpha-glucan branching enzyme